MRRVAITSQLAVVLVLVGCATGRVNRMMVDTTLAAQRSAELDTAQVDQETTLAAAAQAHQAGTITPDAFRRVVAAADELHNTLVRALAEQRLYLVAGSNRLDYDQAFANLTLARRTLSLTWEAARRE